MTREEEEEDDSSNGINDDTHPGGVKNQYFLKTAGSEEVSVVYLVDQIFDNDYSLSVMCDEKAQFEEAIRFLAPLGHGLKIKSAHYRFRTKFQTNPKTIPLAYLASERAGKFRQRILKYCESSQPLIMIFVGAGDPPPFEICRPSLYLALRIKYNVLLFSCETRLNTLQLSILRYIIIHWEMFQFKGITALDTLNAPIITVPNSALI